jgi:hypothetical protein
VNEDNLKGLASAAALAAFALWAAPWWIWLPALGVLALCVVAAIPAGRGPAVPRSELDRIDERLREIQRSLDSY